MGDERYIPTGALAAYVECMWFSDNYEPVTARERVLPSGASQLIVNLASDTFRHFDSADGSSAKVYPHTIVTGVHTGCTFLDSHSRIATAGVVFRPGAISALLGVPARELQDEVVSPGDVRPLPGWSELRDQLLEAESTDVVFRLLSSFLLARVDPRVRCDDAVRRAVAHIERTHGSVPVSDLTQDIGYSRRWFHEIFGRAVGVSAKTYARITRLQHAVRLIRSEHARGWTDLALGAGFFDQAHFIHEFKRFSGVTPGEYRSVASCERNHLPV